MTDEYIPEPIQPFIPQIFTSAPNEINVTVSTSAQRTENRSADEKAESQLIQNGFINPIINAPINSPTFTGTVTLPTVSSTSNDNTAATTAFCKTLVSSNLTALIN